MNDETLWKAVHRIEAAAERASAAAQQMETAAHRMGCLLEDGYGGNGLRLIELLDNYHRPPNDPRPIPGHP